MNIKKKNLFISIGVALILVPIFLYHIRLVRQYDPEGKNLEHKLSNIARSTPKLF